MYIMYICVCQTERERKREREIHQLEIYRKFLSSSCMFSWMAVKHFEFSFVLEARFPYKNVNVIHH